MSAKQPKRRILLTGASGYLGQHILCRLLRHGQDDDDGDDDDGNAFVLPFAYHVYALYGKHEEFAAAVSSCVSSYTSSTTTVTAHSLDLTDGPAVQAWLADQPPMDVCIHTAALSSPRVCQQDPATAQAVNVPTAFFAHLQAQGCRLLALSTDQVYAGDTARRYVETDEARPVNVYGQTKRQMETVLTELFHGTAVILRSSLILGARAPLTTAHDTFVQFCASRRGQPTDFYTDEIRSPVWTRDVVRTILWFVRSLLVGGGGGGGNEGGGGAELGLGGLYNMGGPVPLSRVDLAHAVFRHLGWDPNGVIVETKKADGAVPTVQAGVTPSPLDISMDSRKLWERLVVQGELLGGEFGEFAGLDVIVADALP